MCEVALSTTCCTTRLEVHQPPRGDIGHFHAELRDRQVVYCVSDNGAGFDMNFATKLFLPFHRLHGISGLPARASATTTVQRVIPTSRGARVGRIDAR